MLPIKMLSIKIKMLPFKMFPKKMPSSPTLVNGFETENKNVPTSQIQNRTLPEN